MGADQADILVVEDDADLCDSIASILRGEGHRIRTCANGCEALGAIAEAVPSLVLLDLMMPIMSGWGVVEWLRTHAPDVLKRIVIMSASGCDAPEVTEYLRKPFEVDDLLAVVGRRAHAAGSAGSANSGATATSPKPRDR